MDKLELTNLTLFKTEDGKVWIKRTRGAAAGEGGQFDAAKLEQVIEQFYNENF